MKRFVCIYIANVRPKQEILYPVIRNILTTKRQGSVGMGELPDGSACVRCRMKGFTLIELLAVIAILLILILLLSTGFGKMTGRAQQIQCISNLKQLSLALRAYASDHNGSLPRYFDASDTVWWPNILTQQGYTPDGQPERYGRPLGRYVCPSQPNSQLPWSLASDGVGQRIGVNFFTNIGGNNWLGSHYGINEFLMETRDYTQATPKGEVYEKINLFAVKHPSSVFFICDTADLTGGFMRYYQHGYANMILRHNKNTVCNMLFVDGHGAILTEKHADHRHDNIHFNDQEVIYDISNDPPCFQ